MTRCGGEVKACMSSRTRCLTHDLWEGLGEQIYTYLSGLSLADVCARRISEKFPRGKALPRGGDVSPKWSASWRMFRRRHCQSIATKQSRSRPQGLDWLPAVASLASLGCHVGSGSSQ